MCEICGRSPCHPRCPNSLGPKAVHICKVCKDAIVDGEECYEMDGKYYHEGCFEDNAVKILIEECGAMKGVADADDGRY